MPYQIPNTKWPGILNFKKKFLPDTTVYITFSSSLTDFVSANFISSWSHNGLSLLLDQLWYKKSNCLCAGHFHQFTFLCDLATFSLTICVIRSPTVTSHVVKWPNAKGKYTLFCTKYTLYGILYKAFWSLGTLNLCARDATARTCSLQT